MKIKNVITEAKAQFGGEVIDAQDLPEKMQKKVSSIAYYIGLRSHLPYTVEGDLKGQFIYIVFKGGAQSITLSKIHTSGIDTMLVKNNYVALAIRKR